jgi:hypothetical protein
MRHALFLVPALLVCLAAPSLAPAGDADEDRDTPPSFRVYDATGRYQGRVHDGRIFDAQGRFVGRIRHDRVYDATGRYQGRVEPRPSAGQDDR